MLTKNQFLWLDISIEHRFKAIPMQTKTNTLNSLTNRDTFPDLYMKKRISSKEKRIKNSRAQERCCKALKKKNEFYDVILWWTVMIFLRSWCASSVNGRWVWVSFCAKKTSGYDTVAAAIIAPTFLLLYFHLSLLTHLLSHTITGTLNYEYTIH